MSKKKSDGEGWFYVVPNTARSTGNRRGNSKWREVSEVVSSGKTVSIPASNGQKLAYLRSNISWTLKGIIGSTHVIHTSVDKQANAVIVWADAIGGAK